MEKKKSNSRQLFALVKDSPMQFTIILSNALGIECERVLRHIEDQGGEFMGFDPQDSEYINLASSKYEAPPNQIIFDIKYIKRCVKEKRLLDLNAFQINGEKLSDPGCIPLYKLLETKRCEHCQTAEEVLEIIKNA